MLLRLLALCLRNMAPQPGIATAASAVPCPGANLSIRLFVYLSLSVCMNVSMCVSPTVSLHFLIHFPEPSCLYVC